MGENKKGIKQWIEDHKLNAIWNGLVFMIDGSRFIEILPKEGKILVGIGDDLQVNYTSDELEALHSVDYMVFKFSENYYYAESPIGVGEPLNDLTPFKYIGDAKKLIPLNFPYVGIHSAFELCNGSRLYSDWCNKAKFLGFNTIGICEKNTLAGTLEFQSTCKKVGIKPIIGATYTVKRNDYLYNVKLYVKNQGGWQNLLRVNKVLNVDNVDSEVPFIDEDSLLLKLEGLVCVFSSDTRLDANIISKYKQQTSTVYYQFDTVKWKADDIDKAHLVKLKRYLQNFKTILPPILICDSYYLDVEDHRIKKKLNIIGKAGFEHQSDNQYFKNIDDYYSELAQLFGSKEEDTDALDELFLLLIENTQQLDQLCEFEIPLGELHLPEYKLTEEESQKYQDNEDLFWALIEKGLADKNINSQEYIDRLETEVAVIKKGGVLDYFLILWDIVEFARRSGILVGVGRGSAGGSLVSYLLGLTKLDPIKYGLLFERFLNESRLGKEIEEDYYIMSDNKGETIELIGSDEVKINRFVSKNTQILYIYAKDIQKGDEILCKM